MTAIEDPKEAKLRKFVMEGAYQHYRAFLTRTNNTIAPDLALERLSLATLSMIAVARGTDYEYHVYKFLMHSLNPQPNDLTAEFIRLMPHLDEEQRFMVRMYLNPLKLWRSRFAVALRHMVKYGNEYLASTGFEALPCTSPEDQKLFERLRGKDQVIAAITERVKYTKEITPELLAELEATTPALVSGAL